MSWLVNFYRLQSIYPKIFVLMAMFLMLVFLLKISTLASRAPFQC